MQGNGGTGLTHSPLSNFPTLFPLPSHNKYAFILQVLGTVAIRQLGKRCVRLHEHGCVEGHIEELAKLLHSFLFRLAAAIGEENEGDAMGLEIGEGAMSTREGFRRAKEDAVDAANHVSRGSAKLLIRGTLYSNANAKLGTLD